MGESGVNGSQPTFSCCCWAELNQPRPHSVAGRVTLQLQERRMGRPLSGVAHHPMLDQRINGIEGQRSEKCLQKRPQAKPKDLEHIRILT